MAGANKLYVMILTSCNQQSSIDFNGKTLICTSWRAEWKEVHSWPSYSYG